MKLSDRISLIIKESGLKQRELAAQIGVTESYISALINGRNLNASQSFANLIEVKFGYSASWVLTGEEPKFKRMSANPTISDTHRKAILQLEKMSNDQVKAVLAFMKSLGEIEDTFSSRDHPTPKV